jgi:CBS domain containing-hemolysin-like protein
MLLTFILLSLFLSALFSGTEIAFISASKLQVELKRSKGSRKGAILAKFYQNPADFLSTMLVGNNIALVVFTALMTIPLNQVFVEYFHIKSEIFVLLINTVIITIVILIFGEFLPKTLFRLFSSELLYFLTYPLLFLRFLLFIPAWVMTKFSNFFIRFVLQTPITEVNNVITRLDLENFVKDSQTDSEDEIDTNLFEKALHLKKVKVKECMVPRTEVENIDVNASIEDLIQVFTETNLSKIIVTKDDIDNVLGYVHHQQMLNEPNSIEEIVMEISFVPEVMRVRDLMNQFIKEQMSIACVVNEFGGVAGLITLEDILEEIFGEIEDEHDKEEYVETQFSENEYIFSGRLEIDYLNEKYENLNFPEGDYTTLSGYLVTTIETIPAQGAEIELNGYKFILELVSDTKIETIRVIKMQAANEEMDQ